MTIYNNYLIPLDNVPEQFEIRLAGVDYTITSKYNPQIPGWVIDIADVSGVPIVSNIPLVTGMDLLDGLDYLGIGGGLFIQTVGNDPDAAPDLEDLGVDSNLYFQTASADE